MSRVPAVLVLLACIITALFKEHEALEQHAGNKPVCAASAATTAAVGCLDARLKQQDCSRTSGSQSKETLNQAAVAAGVQPGQILADIKAAAKSVDGKATGANFCLPT